MSRTVLWALVDVVFGMLGGMIALVVMLITIITTQISPPAVEDMNKIVIQTEWNKESADDIDLWIMDPVGTRVGYNNKSGNGIVLERDDLGWSTDKVVDSLGRVTVGNINLEELNLRTLIPGRYYVNLFVYKRKGKWKQTINTKTSLTVVTPFQVYEGVAVDFNAARQERTVLMFDVGFDGSVEVLPPEENLFVPTGKLGAAVPPTTGAHD